jgi:signal transduction histidine kinase
VAAEPEDGGARILRDLGERSLAAGESTAQVCRSAVETLATNPRDFPFALVYLLEEDGAEARLCGTVGLPDGGAASPERVRLGGAGDRWGFDRVVASNRARVVDDLESRFGRLPAGDWEDATTRRGLVLPLSRPGSQELPAGFFVAGLSPRLDFNADYRSFLELTTGQLATALANARAYEEERRRAEALAELDRAKTVFFSNVSHEFRTPLTLMLGPLEEVLARGEELAAADRELLGVAHRNSLRLLKLVNTLLDFSRLEAGRIEASYEPADLATLTAELASVFRSAIERAGLRLVVDCPPLGEPVYVDREMWEKVVFNLLSNAFKNTFEGEIEVTLRETETGAELTVRDTGTGIPAAELPHLFERFHRVKGARARTFEGSGIGLSLVRELTLLHGGSVSVDSAVDRGSTFTVALPRGSAHLPADRIGAERTVASTRAHGAAFLAEVSRWPGAEDVASGLDDGLDGPAASVQAIQPTAPPARILLADDNVDMRDYVARLLGQHHRVVAVSDGAAAWSAAREQPFDLPTRSAWSRCSATCSTTPPSTPTRADTSAWRRRSRAARRWSGCATTASGWRPSCSPTSSTCSPRRTAPSTGRAAGWGSA